MKVLPLLLLCWIMAGTGAVAGSMLGNAVGRTGLMAGATLGGLAASALAPWLAGLLQWLPRPARGAASAGAVAGFAVAAPIAVMSLHTPIIPAAVTSLVGIGALIGAGWAQGRAGQPGS